MAFHEPGTGAPPFGDVTLILGVGAAVAASLLVPVRRSLSYF